VNCDGLTKKTIVCNIAEELESRSSWEQEGLFRVSGSKSEVEQKKAAYDNGLYPNLGCVRDDHALTGNQTSNSHVMSCLTAINVYVVNGVDIVRLNEIMHPRVTRTFANLSTILRMA
jgi:hypothetical protein